jgi:hypothetical protein
VLAANGGYFPTSWGWAGLLLAWGAVLGALLGAVARPSRLELTFIGGLTAFAVWQALSALWGPSTAAGLEVERTFVYVAAALAFVALVRREYVRLLLGGLLSGVVIICVYSLATRLFPSGFNSVNSWTGARLSSPVGYWNGLGIVAGMGTLFALGFVARAATAIGRTAAGAAVPLLVTTLYFTFSRGAWLSTIVGLVVLFAVDRSRVRLAISVAPIALVAALVILEASRANALTHVGGTLAAATHDGHRVAAVVLIGCIVCAYAAFVAGKLRAVPRQVERAVPWAGAAVVAVAIVAVLVAYGAPWTIARHGYDSFTSKPPASGDVNLNSRLFSLSNNGRLQAWHVAVHAFEAHPLAGIGAGGFEQYWDAHRPVAATLRDAHSLYLETLAETGIVGLVILLVALLAPLAAFRRARQEPFAAFALAAYVAFLVEAAVDWDWELSGVTLLAVFAGAVLLRSARDDAPAGRWRFLPVAAGSVVALLALGGLVGNLSLSSSAKAAAHGHWSAAATDAKRARFFAPWSAQPWDALGRAQIGLGQTAQAHASYIKALARDPGNAVYWVDLARLDHGQVRLQDLSRALSLDPLDPALANAERELVLPKGPKP